MTTLFRPSRSTRFVSLLVLEFLYPPALRSALFSAQRLKLQPNDCSSLRRQLHTETQINSPSPPPYILDLPRSCPGCGAYSQAGEPREAGFYSAGRPAVKAYLAQTRPHSRGEKAGNGAIIQQVLTGIDESLRKELGFNDGTEGKGGPSQGLSTSANEVALPVCDRCQRLLHNRSEEPSANLTVQSVSDMIYESPHKQNHIYHVLDAADFPLSLIPSLQKNLSLSPQRSRNRRSPPISYRKGRRTDMSFIITRADLLAPEKEQVDRLMPYLVQVLRDAMGASAEDVRLGNVRCVSSMRGWWTKAVKEDVWNRGGGGWMVGKANVGKSSLLENIFPKGRPNSKLPDAFQRLDVAESKGERNAFLPEPAQEALNTATWKEEPFSESQTSYLGDSLLPPAPLEQRFPRLPLVSSLPGTTAAPIRNLFGNGKGELIDLPGLSRGDLRSFVKDEYKNNLVMVEREKPEQITIKTGQTLMIGGLLTITPKDPDVTILAYPFLPLPTHVTASHKAKKMVEEESFLEGTSIARSGIAKRMLPAATFSLKWDVTKQRAGPLTSKAAVGLNTSALPFVVFSADILVEGCGWVELVAQVRKKRLEAVGDTNGLFDTTPYPVVEIESPDGRHVGVRRPMGAWLLSRIQHREKTTRPRRSMKGVKKQKKKEARAASLNIN